MWIEDRVAREPQGFRDAPSSPLDCFGPLGDLPDAPAGPGRFSFPTPGAAEPAVLHAFPARGRPRGTVVLVPPWKTPPPARFRSWIAMLGRAGWDTWFLVPPEHLERTGPGRRSGEGLVGADLSRMRRALEQLVREIRASCAVAAGRGPVGLLGFSLGALAAALAATAREPLAFAALLAPPDLATVVEETPIGRRYRLLAERAGAPVPGAAALRAFLAPLDPATRRPTARRLFVAGGVHDVIALRGPESLARAWGVEARVYPRGHLTLLFACRALRLDVVSFLREEVS